MDGLLRVPVSEFDRLAGQVAPEATMQRTLKSAISCSGAGLHSARPVSVTIKPAEAGAGISFQRADLGVTVAATFDHVVDTRLCTMLGHGGACVGTVEHLMAAFVGAGVDNAVVVLDGPEVPVLDGSAEPWLFLLDCAGTVAQDRPRRVIEVRRTIRVGDGDAFVELRPAGLGHGGLDMALSIAFEAEAIGRQALTFTSSAEGVRRELARARTFALRHEIEGLQRAGLALGGSLANAIVVDGGTVLNPSGLRMADEFVRHKMLDAVGDLALAGGALRGRFIAHKSGHRLNNMLLRALFADPANWRVPAESRALLAA